MVYQATTVQVPGKLYIAGEYAVLNPGNPAIIVALDAFITCQVQRADDHQGIRVYSPSLSQAAYTYVRKPLAADPAWSYVHQAISTVLDFLDLASIPAITIKLQSDLVSETGQKYGLGSSGAVTVAIVKGLLKFLGQEQDDLTYFKLATIASIKVSEKGSMGDIAAAVQTGWTYYQSLDRAWLIAQIQNNIPIHHLVKKDWPQLQISPINVHPSLQLAIGWTGQAASTDALVTTFETGQGSTSSKQASSEQGQPPLVQAPHEQVQPSLEAEESAFDLDQWQKNAAANVISLKLGLEKGDFTIIQDQFKAARQLLRQIGRHKGIEIETPRLRQLIDQAEKLGWASKSSGAGGGDCGIALGLNNQSVSKAGLDAAWQKARIQPLAYVPYDAHSKKEG